MFKIAYREWMRLDCIGHVGVLIFYKKYKVGKSDEFYCGCFVKLNIKHV